MMHHGGRFRGSRLKDFNPDDPELTRKLPGPPRDGLSPETRERIAADLRNEAALLTQLADHAAVMHAENLVIELISMVRMLRYTRDRALT